MDTCSCYCIFFFLFTKVMDAGVDRVGAWDAVREAATVLSLLARRGGQAKPRRVMAIEANVWPGSRRA